LLKTHVAAFSEIADFSARNLCLCPRHAARCQGSGIPLWSVGAVRRTGLEGEQIVERGFGPLLPGLESTFVDSQAGNSCVERLARESQLFAAPLAPETRPWHCASAVSIICLSRSTSVVTWTRLTSSFVISIIRSPLDAESQAS